MTTIIRKAQIKNIATLAPTGEIFFEEEKKDYRDLFSEEYSKSYEEGLHAGEQAGYEKALVEMKGMFDLMRHVCKKLLEQKERLLDQLKPEIIEFCLAVCERIIRRELSQPEALAKLLQSLLCFATATLKQDLVEIVIAPDDLLLIQQQLKAFFLGAADFKDVRFKTDSLMKRGDVRIETKTGLLNYDISRELSDLQSKVLQR